MRRGGFVGLCTKQYIGAFEKFGLKVVYGPKVIEERRGKEYFIVAASYTTMGLRAWGYIFMDKVKNIFFRNTASKH